MKNADGPRSTYAIIMPLQVGFALELFLAPRVAIHGRARVGVFSLWIVGLHVRFVVVAPFEEFAAHGTLVRRIGLRGRFALSRGIGSGAAGNHRHMRWAGVPRIMQIGRVGWSVCAAPAGLAARMIDWRAHRSNGRWVRREVGVDHRSAMAMAMAVRRARRVEPLARILHLHRRRRQKFGLVRGEGLGRRIRRHR